MSRRNYLGGLTFHIVVKRYRRTSHSVIISMAFCCSTGSRPNRNFRPDGGCHGAWSLLLFQLKCLLCCPSHIPVYYPVSCCACGRWYQAVFALRGAVWATISFWAPSEIFNILSHADMRTFFPNVHLMEDMILTNTNYISLIHISDFPSLYRFGLWNTCITLH